MTAQTVGGAEINEPSPRISVVIAAFNARGFLQRAVESAVAQTLPPLEVLVVDDASTDATASLVRRLAQVDGRIRLIALDRNGGPSVARNAGLDAAQGDWVAILDADDAFVPDRLEALAAMALATGADIVVDNFHYCHPERDEPGPLGLAARDGVEVIDACRFVAQARPFTEEADWGLLKPLLRKAFFDAHGLRYPVRSRHGEDFLLIVDALLTGARYVLTRRPGYLYTERSSGFSRTKVDYPLMRQHSEALLHDPRVAANVGLCGNIRARIAALRRLAAERDFEQRRQQQDHAGIVRQVLNDAAFRGVVVQRVAHKLKGLFQNG